ncbi:MAG: methyltransferase domain-containing protein [Magnetococcales bacterium]|nr:methyltransferase domain-containing protein [Magnetococcales bacterium]
MTDKSDGYNIVLRKTWQDRQLLVIDEAGYRSLYFDNHLTQSRMDLQHPLWLILPYTRHMLAALLYNPQPQQVLMIGLGGGSLAKFLLHAFPSCRIDAIDANPLIPAIAQHLFFLPSDPRLTMHCADGAEMILTLATQKRQFDLILIDAFDHDGMSPSIYADSFLVALQRLLTENGVVAFNLNRAETSHHRRVSEQISHRFSAVITRLPVAAPSRNEIIFCCRQPITEQNSARLRHKAEEWKDHQPPLLFDDFLQRMTAVQPTARLPWLERIQQFWRDYRA